VIDIYEGLLVSQDEWLYNSGNSGYGILGLGPGSSLWNAFIDPSTHTATYSIALARLNQNAFSNITIGNVGNSEDYINQTSITVINSE
jgi:hypothetical protein